MLEDFLRSHADKLADKVAIACGDKAITYAELYTKVKEEASLLAQQCHTQGVDPNSLPIIVRSRQTIDLLVTYFAAHLTGRPFVPLEKDIADERFFEIGNILGTTTLPQGVADILFTSGTTGNPKGVMISHEAIMANGDNLVYAQGFTTNLAFVISGPLCHIGSLSKVWPSIMVGATIVIVDGIKDMATFLDAFDYPSRHPANSSTHPDHQSTKVATFLVPASIRMLLQFAPQRLEALAQTIDFIETGAAPMALADMQRLCALLPHSRLYNTYASTETGIIATHNFNSPNATIAGCLGRPMKHSKIIIGDDGRIMCGGKTLMMGYVGSPLLTPNSPQTTPNSILLATSDLGSIDTLGRLNLEGRIDDIINVGGYKVSPIEVENVAMRFPGIADCICISAPHPILGNVLKLIYAANPSATIAKSALVVHLRKELEAYKVPLAYEQAKKIVRNPNGKLDRKYYREKWTGNN